CIGAGESRGDYALACFIFRILRRPLDIQGEHCERVVTQRSGVAQGKFKALLIENFAGRCAVTGWVNGGVLDAAHIEHGTRYNPSNGILMTPTMHALFDADLMGIDPATLTVHFKPGIELGELFEGRKITPLVYDLDLERLAVRWAGYQGLAHEQ
ncbi:HNH endonuclease signature motif containing protein, partial [Klebsiella pneumoniae]